MICGLLRRPTRTPAGRSHGPLRRRVRASRASLLLWANVLLTLMQVQPSGWTFALLAPAALLLALAAFVGPSTATGSTAGQAAISAARLSLSPAAAGPVTRRQASHHATDRPVAPAHTALDA